MIHEKAKSPVLVDSRREAARQQSARTKMGSDTGGAAWFTGFSEWHLASFCEQVRDLEEFNLSEASSRQLTDLFFDHEMIDCQLTGRP